LCELCFTQVVLFINPGQVNSAVRDSLTPEDMEESVTILHYTAVKGKTTPHRI
jgi:hypothetical protein